MSIKDISSKTILKKSISISDYRKKSIADLIKNIPIFNKENQYSIKQKLKLLHNLKIIKFNHISENLSESEIEMLINFYAYYHKQAYIYKKTYILYKSLYITFNIITGLLACTSIVSIFTLPLIAIAGGITIIITSINEGLGFRSKYESCETAFKCFQDLLDDIRSYLRGNEYSEDLLIDEMLIKEKMVKFPDALGIDFYSKKYDKKYYK